ncbi:hypothetical protein [Nonomuraea sp. GTA35]|uniref:hypothetical protein n=1 Tax=Nonomuraea sp. GTA35 TaxID=1676746 RepID=UPI0035BFEE1E
MMPRPRTAAALAGAALALALLGAAVPAQAVTGQVVVFSHEFSPLITWDNPTGCHRLPAGAHQLNNQTDRDVRVYADPYCLTPGMTIPAGHGAHVHPTTASFSA